MKYKAGEDWAKLFRQGIELLERLAHDDRVRIRQPRRNLQLKLTRVLSTGDEFVSYIDAVGELDGTACLIDWKTTTSRYAEEPDGLVSLDPQLVCYSWMSGISEVALVLAAVTIPQTLVAQAPQPETSAIEANSSPQAAPRLQLSAVRDNVPTRLGIQQTASLLNFANMRTDLGRYPLLGGIEESKPPTEASPGERSIPHRAGTKAAFRPTPELRKPPVRLWRTLVVVQHSAAVFDAWSTRDAIRNSGAHELNPFLRPFAGSNAIYAATQVGPGLLDYLGYRMMRSKKGWMRRFWWVPQLAGTVGSLFSGAHNLVVAQGGPPSLAP